MRVEPQIFRGPNEVGEAAAAVIADGIAAATARGRAFVLGCPSGRSAQTTYRALARLIGQRGLDLSGLVIALMDEYVEPEGGSYRAIPATLPHSCVGFGEREIIAVLNAAAGEGRRIPADNLWWPDPQDPAEYDRRLVTVGGIDVFLLASGASDGHVALNPVGAPAGSCTRIVRLEDSTRQDNLLTFPTLRRLDAVPHFGVTVGIATIREQSKSVIMLALGGGKAEAVRQLGSAVGYDPGWPATVLAECRNAHFFIDHDAAALLPDVA